LGVCSGSVPVLFPFYSGSVSVPSGVCSGSVPVLFPLYPGYVSVLFGVCAGYVPVMFPFYSGYVSVLFGVCSGYVPVMFPILSRNCPGKVRVTNTVSRNSHTCLGRPDIRGDVTILERLKDRRDGMLFVCGPDELVRDCNRLV